MSVSECCLHRNVAFIAPREESRSRIAGVSVEKTAVVNGS